VRSIAYHKHKMENDAGCSLRAWKDLRTGEWPSEHSGEDYPLKLSALHTQYTNLRRHLDDGHALHDFAAVRAGRPQTFNAAEKQEVIGRVNILARHYTNVTRNMFAMEVDAVLVKRRPGETDDSGALKRCCRGGGPRHLRTLGKELKISFCKTSKAMEKERAMANQPETTVNYYRCIFHTHVQMHIHRRYVEMQSLHQSKEPADIARRTLLAQQLSDISLPPDELIQYNGEGGPDAIFDQLVVKNDELWVKCLNEKLVTPKPRLIINGDENPFNIHNATRTGLRMGSSPVNVQAASRAPFWTVVCWTRSTSHSLCLPSPADSAQSVQHVPPPGRADARPACP
jgi:hypothetical protein